MGWHMYGDGWGGMMFGLPGMLLFWLVLFVAIFVLIRFSSERNRQDLPPREKTALDILKERYARGEIGREEFEEKKRDLSE